MTVTASQVAARIGLKDDDPRAVALLPRADALVTDALSGRFRDPSEGVRDEMVLSVAFALHDRTKSSHGIAQSTVMEGATPVRAPRDPLASIRTLLAEYVVGLA